MAKKKQLRVRMEAELDQLWSACDEWVDSLPDLRRWVELLNGPAQAERLRTMTGEDLIGVHLLAAAAFGECFKRQLERAAVELQQESPDNQGDTEC